MRRAENRRRDQQPPHAHVQLPHTRRGIRRRTVKLTRPNGGIAHLQIAVGCLILIGTAHMQAIIPLSSKFVLYAHTGESTDQAAA